MTAVLFNQACFDSVFTVKNYVNYSMLSIVKTEVFLEYSSKNLRSYVNFLKSDTDVNMYITTKEIDFFQVTNLMHTSFIL